MKILISRTDALGDTLLTMPIAKLLRDKWPDADIRFLISPICEDLFLGHPYVNGVFIFDKNRPFFKKIQILKTLFKSFKPDLYIYCGGSHLPSCYSWWSGVPERGGLISKFFSFIFLNKGVRQKRSLVTMHESDYNLNLLTPFGIAYHYQDRDAYTPQISLQREEISSARDLFNENIKKSGLDTSLKTIFIHPGMTGHTLNWSSRNYGRLIVKLSHYFEGEFNIIISHTPSDAPYLIGVRDHLRSKEQDRPGNIYYFDGSEHGLRHYMAILSEAALFVGPSTGTLHIAATLGVDHIGIYSPIKVQSSLRWGPFSSKSTASRRVIPDVVCGEQFHCAGMTCPYYECMSKIEVNDIFTEVIKSLESE